VGPEQPLRGNVILVVDDEPDSVAALERLIAEAFGCRVLTASSGDEALRVIDSGAHVDLVLTDVVMPEMDGVTLTLLIKGRLPGLPVVLATGRPDVVDLVTQRGGIALLKPYSLERLEAVLNEHLRVARFTGNAGPAEDRLNPAGIGPDSPA
jgi:DNA-binding NtrC family response regulator